MRRLRTKHKRAIAVGVAVLVLLGCVALFVRSYNNAGPDASGPIPTPAFTPALIGPSSAPSPTSTFFPKPGDKITLGNRVFSVEPGGFTFRGATPHTVRITASSATAIGKVGYLIPTSPDSAYGLADHVGPSFSLTTDAFGKPQYALVFIQAGPAGVPISCSVSIDGKVVNTSTTKGPYGRTVCVG